MVHYQAFEVQASEGVGHVRINRPAKANAMDAAFWAEIPQVFEALDDDPNVRVIILSGAGKHFSAGIDLGLLAAIAGELGRDAGRNARQLRRRITQMQQAFNALEACSKPVLAAIHGYCLGAGIDLIAACDLRYAAADAQFSIKEIDMGMVADVGTLQRLPHLIGAGMLRELAFTGRHFDAAEALRIGLVNQVHADSASLLSAVQALAVEIAGKSPLAVSGTKRMLNYMRDHSVADGLDYVATWNAAMLQAPDVQLALGASLSKTTPRFDD